jgi:hypothetical protein
MRLRLSKYKLWQIMVAIAAFAGLFAAFGVVNAIGISMTISVVVLPILLAGPRRKLGAAAWVFALYPLFCLGSLYATWLTAWCVLGDRPRPSEDNPKHISVIVDVPYTSTMAFLWGLPAALVVVGPLVLAHNVLCYRSERMRSLRLTAGLLIPLLIWLSVLAVVWFRLLRLGDISEWFVG